MSLQLIILGLQQELLLQRSGQFILPHSSLSLEHFFSKDKLPGFLGGQFPLGNET